MKTSARWIITVTGVCMFSACSSEKGHGGDTGIGGSQAGGSPGTGGATFGTGGAIDVGGTTGTPGCAVDGEAGALEAAGSSAMPIVVTSRKDCFWQRQLVTQVDDTPEISVNDGTEAQTWEGFGGAFTERAWAQLSQLSEADRTRAIKLLFGPQGARFTWGRLPIGCNDYSAVRHSLDDTGDDVIPDSTESNRPPADLTLSKFSIDGDLKNLIPFIKAAQAVKPELRFWAAAWTPPVWMKTGYATLDANGRPVKRASYYDGGSMRSDAALLQAHAQYFVKYVQAYQAQGIPVEMVAPQNEPAGGHNYPSCLWDSNTYTSFIGNYLGPALSGAGLATKIMLGGSLDDAQDTSFVTAVLADPTAKAYCAIAGLGYDMVATSKVAALKAAGIPLWVSEHKAGNYWWTEGHQPVAPNDMAYAVETWGLIRDAINKVGVTAYNAWHLVLDKVGQNIDVSIPWAQDTLLIADAGELTATPVYYVFRHFSRFVEPGAKVLSSSGGDAMAFRNPDGTTVVVTYNSGAARTTTVAVGGQRLRFAMPQSGFATLVVPHG